ncbi:MAG: diacylglycerol kinase family protein [Aeoliella sp.]
MSNTKTQKPIQISFASRWQKKFVCALRGLTVSIRGQNSFYVHLPAALIVLLVAWILSVTYVEWLVLILCITLVLSVELFNTAIEHLARAVTREEHPEIRDALDVASAAVLVAAMGASVVGLLVLVW